jgi:hypothetical protein
MDALGEQLSARKGELKAKFTAEGVPPPTFTTLEETQ